MLTELVTFLKTTARSPGRWTAFVALGLLAASYGYHRTLLLSESPYEAWDEIGTYHNAAVITDPAKWRTYAYGTLDTAKMVLARWYYESMDPVGRTWHSRIYSNNVPASWSDPGFNFHVRNWVDLSAIDFNYFRGVADRRPILIAREINLAFMYLLAAAVMLSATMLYGGCGIPLCLALAFCLTSSEFLYASRFALPDAVCALLALLVFTLCQSAVCLSRPRLLSFAAIFLAVGINHKVDFILMALPVGIAAIQTGFWPGGSMARLLSLAGKLLGCFAATLLATNPYLVATPRLEVEKQASIVIALQGAVNGSNNLSALWDFFGANFALTPAADVITSHGAIAICLGALVALSLLPLLFRGALSWSQRIACLVIVVVADGALFALPVRNSSVIYPRYFLNGWGALLAVAGCGLSVYLGRVARSRRVILVITALALVLCISAVGLRFHQIRKLEVSVSRHLDPQFHLDIRQSRNAATLEALRVAKSGEFAATVLIDQHAYLDLRAFILAGLKPLYINAHNSQDVIRGLPAGRYLTLFTRGDYEIQPRWVGLWPDSIRAKYAAYLDMLTHQPGIWERSGPLTKLLDWRPPQPTDNMTLAVVSVTQ
jgi:hypothetical protein